MRCQPCEATPSHPLRRIDNGGGTESVKQQAMPANDFQVNGFALEPAVLPTPDCEALCKTVKQGQSISGGTRSMLSEEWCSSLARYLMRHPRIGCLLPPDFAAVQCTYFEKSTERNWLVSVHQDLSIPVARRIEAQGYTGWSSKEGAVFVQPPLAVLESLVAVRLHLEPCGPDDGPLHLIPRTQTLGILGPDDAARLRQTHTTEVCTLETGGALVMKPLLLHASSKATGSSRRRVLHFLFGPRTLPSEVRWQYAV